jgi:hypothetical protein
MTASVSKITVEFYVILAYIYETIDDFVIVLSCKKHSTKGLSALLSLSVFECYEPQIFTKYEAYFVHFIIREVKPHVTKTKPTKTNAKRRKG